MVGFGSLFVYTFSVFMKPLGAEFGWGRKAIRAVSVWPPYRWRSGRPFSANGLTAMGAAGSSSPA